MEVERELSSMTVNQEKVKGLFKHLVLAYQKQARKRKTAEVVHEQIAKVKEVAIKRAPKRIVEEEVTNLQEMIARLFNEEKVLLVQQREETRMLLELRARLDDMEKRVLRQPQLSTGVATMKELHEINDALQKISNKLDEETVRLSQVRRAEKEERAVVSTLAVKEDLTTRKIMEIEAQLQLIERKHQQLAEKGYNKDHLKKLKVMINKHKKKLSQLKRKQ